jgi:hypothetical protein
MSFDLDSPRSDVGIDVEQQRLRALLELRNEALDPLESKTGLVNEWHQRFPYVRKHCTIRL